MKRNKKKLKKIIANVMLYTICYRNVDKLNDIWVYAKYDLLGGKDMNVLENVQTILIILSEHKIQIAIILCLICLLNILFNTVVLNNGANDTNNKNEKEN